MDSEIVELAGHSVAAAQFENLLAQELGGDRRLDVHGVMEADDPNGLLVRLPGNSGGERIQLLGRDFPVGQPVL